MSLPGLKEALAFGGDPVVDAFTSHFRQAFGSTLVGVVLYGSCLDDATRTPTSIYDFFLVCDDYRTFYGKPFDALLNTFLVPNTYYLEIASPGAPHARLACKYNVVSLGHLRRETGARATDSYLFGRLGKRVGISYARDAASLDALVDCMGSAMLQNLRLLTPTLPDRLALDDLVVRLLSLSYRGDFRIERDTKIQELFAAGEAHYRRFYGELLARGEEHGLMLALEGDDCRNLMPEPLRRRGARRSAAFLERSRRRSVYRWPKGFLTFGGYVDYLQRKVERAKGIRIELTERERKYPLLFAWKHFFRLKRQGLLK